MSPRTKAIATLVVGVLLVVLGALLQGGEDGGPTRATDQQQSQQQSQQRSQQRARDAGTDPLSGLPRIHRADLPAEARETLELIGRGGPFPHDRDGVVFHNYEGLLPDRPDGYYREYTVPTPGIDHRGARRIVAGEPREWYWTDDHYASFAVVLP